MTFPEPKMFFVALVKLAKVPGGATLRASIGGNELTGKILVRRPYRDVPWEREKEKK